MHSFIQDLRYTFRQIRNSPGFAAITVLVLALGIGVSIATFTVLNAVLLRKPPFSRIDRLVSLIEPRGRDDVFSWGVSLPDVRDWRERSHSFEQIAYLAEDTARWERDSSTQKLDLDAASGNFFAALGAKPALGRTFSDEEEHAKAKVVVLNYTIWQESYGSDAKVLGQTMKLNGEPYQIIGVMPKGFAFPRGDNHQAWKPFATDPDADKRDSALLNVFGRLHPGVTPEQAQSELSAIQKVISQEHPADNLPDRVEVRRYWETIVGKIRPALLLLAAAVALIWLVACANVASLMLTRNSVRQREIAVRRALGAGRLRLVRQLLTENLVFGLIASAAGLGLAFWSIRLLEHRLLREISVQGVESLRIDSTVLLILVALSVISTVAFGLLPAILASGSSIQPSLGVRSGQSTGKQGHLRDGLVVGEIAVSLLLLVAAGLLLRSLHALHQIPLGFATENIITSAFVIPPDRYTNESVNVVLYQPMVARLEQIPGVKSAAVTSVMPLKRGFQMVGMFGIAGRKPMRREDMPQGDLRFSSPEYPQTLGITVERGRFFDASIDTSTSQPVAVVNHTFAARYLQGEDPTQHALSMGQKPGWKSVPIVGVIADVRQTAVNLPPGPEIHLATTQLTPGAPFYNVGSEFSQLAVRTRQKPETLIDAIRKAAHDVAPDVATGNFDTMSEVVEDNLGSQVLAARLLSLFAGATLLITVMGLYGLLSYSVGQRTQEIGIRMALGAQRTNVVLLVVRHALLLLLFGLALGIALAFTTSRVLRSFLYGVHEHDALTTVAVSLLLCVCGIAAAYLPARRAASVDPIEALRTE